MFLSVYEAARLLELKSSQVYYRLELCQVEGAIKIGSTWRLDEEGVRRLYERLNAQRAGILPGFVELIGFDAVLEDIRKASLSSDKKSCHARVPGRQRVACDKSRPDKLAGVRRGEKVEQLHFDFY